MYAPRNRCLRGDGDDLDAFDQTVEGTVPGLDAGFEELEALEPLGHEARGDLVVSRQIEIDEGVEPRLGPTRRRLRLQEPSGQPPGLDEQEETDLDDVGARREVHDVVFRVDVERVGANEVVQPTVDLFEIPRVIEVDGVQMDLGLRGDECDVADDGIGERARLRLVDELEAIDEQVFVPTQIDGRTPRGPAIGPGGAIAIHAEDGKGDRAAHRREHNGASSRREGGAR